MKRRNLELPEEWHEDRDIRGKFSRAVRRGGKKAPIYCHVRDDRDLRSKDRWAAFLILGVDRPSRPFIFVGTFVDKEAAMQAAEKRAMRPWRGGGT